jgi:hypothetical protein
MFMFVKSRKCAQFHYLIFQKRAVSWFHKVNIEHRRSILTSDKTGWRISAAKIILHVVRASPLPYKLILFVFYFCPFDILYLHIGLLFTNVHIMFGRLG